MSIIRAARPQSNFYILDKRISEDRGLSWAARGLLVFLLGKPDHWKVSVEHLRKETQTCAKPSGRDAIYAMLTELINNGYVKRELAQSKTDGTLAGYDYYVFDDPVTLGEVDDAPCTDFPDTAEPDTAEPCTANTTLVSTDSKKEKKKASTEDKVILVTAADIAIQGVTIEAAVEWLAIRRKKKLPLTPLAWKAFQAEVAKAGWDLHDGVMKCIARGWGSFEAEWVSPKRGGGNGKQAEWDAVMAEFVSKRGNPDDPYTIDMEV